MNLLDKFYPYLSFKTIDTSTNTIQHVTCIPIGNDDADFGMYPIFIVIAKIVGKHIHKIR